MYAIMHYSLRFAAVVSEKKRRVDINKNTQIMALGGGEVE
jgi:hypothetical protein